MRVALLRLHNAGMYSWHTRPDFSDRYAPRTEPQVSMVASISAESTEEVLMRSTRGLLSFLLASIGAADDYAAELR